MGLLALAIPFLAFGPGTARAAPPDDLEDHEALEGVDGAAASARFSLKWGDEWSPESGQAEQVLAALDEAWAVQVLELGLPQPDGMAVARLNAYVADTGILVEGERLTLP